MLVNLINFLRGFLLSATQHLERHEAKSLKRHHYYTSPHTRLTRRLTFISLIFLWNMVILFQVLFLN
ncbi:hypothetical protein GB761_11830 [Salmonella enterica]|nr:hypothetical protein [Salmonella enterica]